MMRRDVFFTGPWQRAILNRILVVLLGLWLCVAPQWHVCQNRGLGTGSGLSACCLKFAAAHSTVSAAAPSNTPHLQNDARSDCFCLACYLEFFPILSAAAWVFVALLTTVALRFRVSLHFQFVPFSIAHASRGPPCFS